MSPARPDETLLPKVAPTEVNHARGKLRNMLGGLAGRIKEAVGGRPAEH